MGTPLSADFLAALRRLADELAPGAVTFASALSAAELWERYRAADVFLCLSEHEGFCIPLLEAFHFGLPVIARDAGAVGEVVGDAGVLLDGDDGVATVAELIGIVLGDAELRAELAARGERRLAHYAHDSVAAAAARATRHHRRRHEPATRPRPDGAEPLDGGAAAGATRSSAAARAARRGDDRPHPAGG